MTKEQAQPYFTISRKQATRRSYRTTLRREIAIWSGVDENALNSLGVNHPIILAYRRRKLGLDGPAQDFADWTQFLIREYGPRERCLSLGSGIGRVEKYLIDKGFTDRFESYELYAEDNSHARARDSGRIDTQISDLNFIELVPDSYDFILCHCVLHHLINLEHVLHVVNSALKRDGVFLVYDYVGDTRWQFTEERLDYLRRVFPDLDFERNPLWEVDGFEAIRSGDILGLLRDQFPDTCERSLSFGGVFFPFVNCVAQDVSPHLDRVVELDEEVMEKKMFSPCYHMGLYRKSSARPSSVTPWSDRELELRLSLQTPLYVRLRRAVSVSFIGPFLRAMKRLCLRSAG
jgi:SAM-dependent methyltransferase